jgi:hypothetical protein
MVLSHIYNSAAAVVAKPLSSQAKGAIMSIAKGTILHNNWDEKPYHEASPQKSTEAKIDCVLAGDIEAGAVTRYLLQYPSEANCHYCGYLLVEGSVGGRQGSFMIYEVGDWANGIATSKWQIVPGSGTGGLAGISGAGGYAAQHDKTVHYELDYAL